MVLGTNGFQLCRDLEIFRRSETFFAERHLN